MSKQPESASPSTLEPKKILVSEPLQDAAKMMQHVLELEGYQVFLVYNGQDAVEKARQVKPDLIILEVIMPIMNGLDACKTIKSDPATRDIPLIFLSVEDRREIRAKALAMGANYYFTKPVDPDALISYISSVLGTERKRRNYSLNVTSPHRPPAKKSRDPFRISGTVLNSKYELVEYAGSGGMGAVYRALSLHNRETVAVKVLKPDIVAKSPEYAELFEKEAETVQSLSHPHIVKVFDSGKDDDLSYMVMEWIDGRSVEEVITQGQLPISSLVNIFEQICSAVHFAHKSNIIHLDIKPGNILLLKKAEPIDFVKVIDFGLSRVITRESGTTVTRFRGTHQFCAPEQFGGKVSHRSDIYSLGATLYYLTTGVIPFGVSYINAKIHPNLELPEIPSVTRQRNVPPGLDGVIRKALSKNPELRQQSAHELFEEFKAAMPGETVKEQPTSDYELRQDGTMDETHASGLQTDVYFRIRFKGDEGLAKILGNLLPAGTIWAYHNPDINGTVVVDAANAATDLGMHIERIAESMEIDSSTLEISKHVMGGL